MDWRLTSYLPAVALSVKPFVGLTWALGQPGCLSGSNSEGVPHLAPTVYAGALLLMGWILWGGEDKVLRLYGWVFLAGSSMFATVPLARAWGDTAPDWASSALLAEWVALAVVLVALLIRILVTAAEASPAGRILAAVSAFVFALAVFGPLLGSNPLYVAIVSVISYTGMAGIAVVLAWIHYQETDP